jgi:hypothetical protein
MRREQVLKDVGLRCHQVLAQPKNAPGIRTPYQLSEP